MRGFTLFIAGLLLVLILFFLGGMSIVKNKVFVVIKPLLGSYTTLERTLRAAVHMPRVARDAEELQREVLRLRSEVATLEDIGRENAVLRRALGQAEEEQISFIASRVLFYSRSGIDEYIVIDSGREQGVEEGMDALAFGTIHIGYVLDVAHSTSRVRLFSDSGEKTEVYFSESGISSVAEGAGLGVLTVRVPAGVAIAEEDAVFTQGPHPHLVGFVGEVATSSAGAFQNVWVPFPFHLRDIRIVFLAQYEKEGI